MRRKAKSLPGQVKGKERNVDMRQRIEARSSSGSSRLFSQDISDALSGLRGARGMEVRGSGSGPGFGGEVCDAHLKEGLCDVFDHNFNLLPEKTGLVTSGEADPTQAHTTSEVLKKINIDLRL